MASLAFDGEATCEATWQPFPRTTKPGARADNKNNNNSLGLAYYPATNGRANMKIQMQLLQWIVLFGGSASAVYFWRPANPNTNKKTLEREYTDVVKEVKQNNQALQQFLNKQKNRDPELEEQFDSVLRSGHRRRHERNKNIVVGLDEDV